VKSGAENMRRLKMTYSTPRLVPYSPSSLAASVRKRSTEDERPVENRLSPPGTQPPPLIIEGFEGEVGDLVQVLSSNGWRSFRSPESPAEATETTSEKHEGPLKSGVSMLLVDMRRCFLGSRQPLTRMEMDSDSNATLTVILTDSGQDFMSGGELRRTDRWHFRGPIGTDGLGVLINSVFQIWAAPMETPAKPSSTIKDEQVQRFGNRMCRERVIFYGHILEVDIHNTRRHGAS